MFSLSERTAKATETIAVFFLCTSSGKRFLLGNSSAPLFFLLLVSMQLSLCTLPSAACCQQLSCSQSMGSSVHPASWFTCLLLWRSAAPSVTRSLAPFGALYYSSVNQPFANASMQQYLEPDKILEVRIRKKVVHGEGKRLYLLDSILTTTMPFYICFPTLLLLI